MRRRRFMVLGTVLLAGCGGDGGGDSTETPTETDDTSTDPSSDGTAGESDTPTPEGIENQTGNDADVGGSGNFEATVTFNTCSKVTVEADKPYTAVALSLAGGGTEMNQDGYSGSTTFEADVTIQDVVIWGENGGKDNKVNPDFDACPKP